MGIKGMLSLRRRKEPAKDPTGHVSPRPETQAESLPPPGPAKEECKAISNALEINHRDLWLEAFEKLPRKSQQTLEGQGMKPKGPEPMKDQIEAFQEKTEKMRKECEAKDLTIKMGEHEVAVRQTTVQIVQWVQKIGDVAIQFAPSPGAGVWAVSKLILQVVDTFDKEKSALLSIVNNVAGAIFCAELYDKLYTFERTGKKDVVDKLQDTTVDLYQLILELLAMSYHLSSKTPTQIFHAIFDSKNAPRCYGNHFKEIEKNRNPKTGNWLRQQKAFEDWMTSPSSSVLWLQGSPGTGKTYLSSALVKHFEESNYSQIEGLAFFFCNRDEQNRREASPVLRSLVRQLATPKTKSHNESIRTTLQKAREECDDKGMQLTIEHCRDQLAQSFKLYSTTVLIIDALDEMLDKELGILIEELDGVIGGQGDTRRVKLFVASRPEKDIRARYGSSQTIVVSSEDNQHDIEEYITAEMEKFGKKHPTSDVYSMKEEIIHVILDKCDSMFLWAALQMASFCKCETTEAVNHALENLPVDLEETYANMYRKIQSRQPLDQEMAKRAFMWIICSVNPLKSDVLLSAARMSVEQDSIKLSSYPKEDSLRSICENFLLIDGDGCWRFFHLSAREYIEKVPELINAHSHSEREAESAQAAPDPEYPFRLKHPFTIHIGTSWWLYASGLTEDDQSVEFLKRFIGSPEESSPFFIAWSENLFDLDPHRLLLDPRGMWLTEGDLDTATTPVFAIAYFSLYDIIPTWCDTYRLNPNQITRSGDSLLGIAAKTGCVPLCRSLLSKTVVNGGLLRQNPHNTIHVAAAHELSNIETRHKGRAKEDLELHIEDAHFLAHLVTAAGAGQRDVIRYFVEEAKAEVNLSVDFGIDGSALAAAASGGEADIVRYLVEEAQAKVNLSLNSGKYGSALAAAAFFGRTDIVRYLVEEAQADVNLPLNRGHDDALAAAKEGGYPTCPEIVQYLLTFPDVQSNNVQHRSTEVSSWDLKKAAFLENLVMNMTIPELVLQMHLMFADNIIGPNSDNALYVLDLAKEPRWGRVQEDWGEDMVLTSHMGVAFASGLSKNSTWSDSDAVIPVMKHFAAHGSPQGGHNAAPFMGYGTREVLQEMLVPFKAAVDLGGVKGVMMIDHFTGFVTADDTGISELLYTHLVTSSVADTIAQWHNAGGIIQYYDFPLGEYVDATVGLVSNGTIALLELQSLAKRVLGVKYDLNLFEDPYIADDVDSQAITASHVPLTLEAAQKSIVLLENNNSTLPLQPDKQNINTIALVGPFSDVFNFGDYSGQFGGYPVKNGSTIRQGIAEHLSRNFPDTKLLTSWGANSWSYNGQYNIPPYLLSANGTSGGLSATYFADTNFIHARVQKLETPSLDWGLYPPDGLPSNNFSVIWEGDVEIPVEIATDGWFGVAFYANTSAKLYIDGNLHVNVEPTTAGNILSDIPGISYTSVNSTIAPPGSAPFLFKKGAKHQIRLEYQAWNYVQKFENVNSLNAQVLLFWNLVDPVHAVDQAVEVARKSDVVVLTLGASWNSDGESGDRATLGFSPNQALLADAIYGVGKPVVLILQGGRPFAVPEYYNESAAVLNTFFPGQSGGQAISDVLFGIIHPGGKVPISVPYNAGSLPAFYNYKPSFPRDYTDIPYKSLYPFGYGLSYTNFTTTNFRSTVDSSDGAEMKFGSKSNITFSVEVTNSGNVAGSHVPQVYLLGRVSSIVRPVKQLVAFTPVYLSAGESREVTLNLDVSRYLPILDRKYEWTVESGDHTFALLEHGGSNADTSVNVTLTCVE
ncbi:beta-glucosidase [Penicillium sp. IBT 16267x]|nr:beta-glucosidase [Penicillium sp. IBT 16267x]